MDLFTLIMNKRLEPDGLNGLAEEEVASRLATEGYNELPSAKPRGFLTIALGVVREPMFLLLVACGTIYLLLGDVRDALMLLGFVFLVMGITFVQERKTERALDSLRDLSSPRALVIRDGQEKRIPGREVVRGDLIVLVEGDRIPADAVLLTGTSLSADESLLTGESLPVRKAAAEIPPSTMGKAGGDDLPFLYSGTLVVQGKGVAQVLAIGLKQRLVNRQGDPISYRRNHTRATRNPSCRQAHGISRLCIESDCGSDRRLEPGRLAQWVFGRHYTSYGNIT